MSTTKIKMYPDIDERGGFELYPTLSAELEAIYNLIDSTSIDGNYDSILDEYHSGVLKTVETILATPIGQLQEKLEELLEEVHISMQINYEAITSEEETSDKDLSCEINNTQDNSPTIEGDISDEEMLNTLSD